MGTLCLGIEFTIHSSPWLFFPTFRFPAPPLRSYNLGHKGWKRIILYTFCPSPPLCNVDKTLSSNTSLHFTIFQHWKGEWGCWHLFCRYYDYNFMFLAFSNTICPRLSEFSYALNAHKLHWDLHIRTKCGTCTIYHLLNKMTAHIWLLPNSLTWFADFVFPQNWGFQRFYLL